MSMLNGVLWNLFLAAVPVVLGYGLAWGLKGHGKQRRLPLFLCLPLGVVWLTFLPNTCYLLTEWRHLLFDPRLADLLDAAPTDKHAMLSTAKWALLFLGYSGLGVLLFVLAIRPMERWLRSTGHSTLPYAPLLFFLMSLGVYLGLIVRLNSWDIVTRPLFVWQTAVHALFYPPLLAAIGIFAALLWGLYEAVDLWVDGVAERLRRWGLAGSSARWRTA